MDGQSNTHMTTTSNPVERSKLEQLYDEAAASTLSAPREPDISAGAPPLTQHVQTSTNDAPNSDPQSTPEQLDMLPSPAVPPLIRRDTEPPIGPSTDLPTPMLGRQSTEASHTTGPVILMNLLLTSTGARHPYRIDQKYLTKRGVTSVGENGDFDPFVISVYTLKELIWRDWREEWEPRPLSPAAIRLIHFGRFLEDKLPLKDCRFSDSAPNVVHLSVKPQELLEEEETTKAPKGKGSGRLGSRIDAEGNESTAGCRCVIQ